MRMVKIPSCSYEEFYVYRRNILRDTPYGLLNSEYLKDDEIAFFYFWDTDYIPTELKPYIVRPAKTVSKEPKLSEEYHKD